MKHGSDYIPLRSSTWKLIFCAGLVIFVFAVASAQKPSASKFTVKPLALPGANGLVMLDYLAYDRTSRRLWVPAGNTGSVDVIDATTDEIKRVEGFPVTQVEFRGKLRPVGPSSVAVGDGVVYVGSRADSKICAIDSRSLKLDNCFEFAPPSAGMAAAPDALIYILATREVWATTGAPPVGVPAADRAVQILSAAQPVNLSRIGKIPLHGSAEGYALDKRDSRGLGIDIGYGYGWTIARDGTFSHAGSWETFAWVDPNREIVGIILTQNVGGRNPGIEFMNVVNSALMH